MPTRRRILALYLGATVLAACPSAWAQMGPPPGLSPTGNASALNVTPLGGTVPRLLAATMSDRINVKSFGATGNARRTTVPLTLPVGSTTLTAPVPIFARGDVGKVAVVTGAGAGGAALVTTIAGYTSATTVTLAAPGVTLPPTGTTPGNYLMMWGTDDTAAIAAAITAANTQMAAGTGYPCLYAPGGSYLLTAPPGSFGQGFPGCVEGDGIVHTAFWLSPGFTGNVFDWSDAWIPNISGPLARDFRIDGWLGAAGQQNGLVFYDRNDNVVLENLDFWTLPGRGLYAGVEKNVNEAFIRESHALSHLRFFNDGAPGIPALEITSQNTSGGSSESTNALWFTGIRIFGSNGPSLVIRNANTTKPLNSLTFNEVSVEGTEGGTTAADLVTIGDPVMLGNVNGVTMHDLSLGDPYTGYAALRLTAPNGSLEPYEIAIDGSIGGGIPNGKGVEIDAGREVRMHFDNIYTLGTNFTMGPIANVTGNIRLDVDGNEPSLTYSVDPTTAGLLITPAYRQGVPTAQPALVVNTHDGTNANGALAGAGAVDLQQSRFFYTQAATGANAVIGGGSNNVSGGQNTTVAGGLSNNNTGFVSTIDGGNANTITSCGFCTITGGSNNTLSGSGSATLAGQYATDRGRYNWVGWASGKIANQGDAQTGAQLLRGIITTSGGLRLTADLGSASAINTADIPASTHYHTRVSASCRDTTAAGWASWDALPGDLDRGTGTSVTYAGGYTSAAAPTRSSGTLTTMTLILSADSTNDGLSVAVNAPSGNTDTIHCGSLVETTEEMQ